MTTYAHAHADACLTALGDATRREILERIAQGPQSVGELAFGMPVSRPAVSQHLRVLSDAGLVIGLPEGNRRVYRLDPLSVFMELSLEAQMTPRRA